PLHVELSSGSKGIVIATVANNGSSDHNFLKPGNFLDDKNPVRKVHIGSASGKTPKFEGTRYDLGLENLVASVFIRIAVGQSVDPKSIQL
ncbi:hypothetical protein LTS18_010451, partial [Coniosporium uncinatum]